MAWHARLARARRSAARLRSAHSQPQIAEWSRVQDERIEAELNVVLHLSPLHLEQRLWLQTSDAEATVCTVWSASSCTSMSDDLIVDAIALARNQQEIEMTFFFVCFLIDQKRRSGWWINAVNKCSVVRNTCSRPDRLNSHLWVCEWLLWCPWGRQNDRPIKCRTINIQMCCSIQMCCLMAWGDRHLCLKTNRPVSISVCSWL